MHLNRKEMGAACAYVANITGHRQDLRAKLARVQDNAEELLRLIRENVTEEMAERYAFLSNIITALEMKGYTSRIRFKKKDDDFKLAAIGSKSWKHLLN